MSSDKTPGAAQTRQATTPKDMANAIRALAMDAVQQANSGHPGMPMGMADAATVLFTKFLKFDPANPDWPDRDRFVLSAGHGSMLLYALLYLTGYRDMPIDEIRNFRQLGSKCAGHPEYGEAAGIETTTGPLGQGIANAVGMALAEKLLSARFGDDLVNHRTYAIAGDGCLMEGISHEAMGLAGHLRLNKLVVLFDDNGITIDGGTELSTSEDVPARVAAYGWNVLRADGHDPDAVAQALQAAQDSDKPTLIACKTHIGYGSPNKVDTAGAHGAPLGEDEIAATRAALGWDAAPFEVPEPVLNAWRAAGGRGAAEFAAWTDRHGAADSAQRGEFDRRLAGTLPEGLDKIIADYKRELATELPSVATRKASQNALEVINPVAEETIGGSADLTGSNNTLSKDMGIVGPENFAGRFVHYGIREHGMAAVMNGLALHRGVIPYSGTFLVFTDYCRPAIRLSAMMRQRVIYVMTHDSIGLGEDGPTHQPVEHLASLRAMPTILVFRPADAVETLECWQLALQAEDRPSVLALTRQNLPTIPQPYSAENRCAKGAYLIDPDAAEDAVTLIATGSEVEIAMAAAALLGKEGIAARVASAPCLELFAAQPESYRRAVLGSGLRVAIEAGSTFGWDRYVGDDGLVIGMESFGASAPYKQLYQHFGITPEAVADAVRARIKSAS